ncbi:MAG: UPF0758 domain-containing protein [bacterium]
MNDKKKEKPNNESAGAKWRHPGGKLFDSGAENLSDTELLAILISTGIKGKPAEKIAEEIMLKFGSIRGLTNQPAAEFLKIKGLADVKLARIIAALEITRRCVDIIVRDLKEDKEFHKEVFGE